MRQAAIAGMMLMTMACAPATPPQPAEASGDNVPVEGETGQACDASRAEALIGREATSELGAEALRLTGARSLRWIPPGGMVTMDYRPDRLNIRLDAQRRVTSFNCG